jgi:hypothetical protein
MSLSEDLRSHLDEDAAERQRLYRSAGIGSGVVRDDRPLRIPEPPPGRNPEALDLETGDAAPAW